MHKVSLLTAGFLLSAALLSARPPLAKPLKLPASMNEVLEIRPEGSYMGDAIRISDCTDFLPFGSCSNVLFGGPAIFVTPISGLVQVHFYQPVNNIAHFEISHPNNLSGQNARLRAPQGYNFPITDVFLFDDLGQSSSGDLNLLTGEVTNLNYRLNFFTSFYNALSAVNPKLVGGAFQFPGIYGTGNMEFFQRPDGRLDVMRSIATGLEYQALQLGPLVDRLMGHLEEVRAERGGADGAGAALGAGGRAERDAEEDQSE